MSPTVTPQEESIERPVARFENIATGLVIVIGLVFLADNFGFHPSFALWNNWWALFILIGAVAPASKAVARIRRIGGIDARVAHWMLSAFVTTAIALMFLLEVSFGQWWPMFMVIGGLYMMFPGRKGSERRWDRTDRCFDSP